MALLQQRAMAGGSSMMPPPEGFGASQASQGLLGATVAPQSPQGRLLPQPPMPQPTERQQVEMGQQDPLTHTRPLEGVARGREPRRIEALEAEVGILNRTLFG